MQYHSVKLLIKSSQLEFYIGAEYIQAEQRIVLQNWLKNIWYLLQDEGGGIKKIVREYFDCRNMTISNAAASYKSDFLVFLLCYQKQTFANTFLYFFVTSYIK